MNNKKTKHINDLITSIINPMFEDTIQDVWVKLLESGKMPTDEVILHIAQETNRQAGAKEIGKQYRETSLDEPLREGDDESGTRHDVISNENKKPEAPPDFDIETKTEFDLTPFIDVFRVCYGVHVGQCLVCGDTADVDYYEVCKACAYDWVNLYSKSSGRPNNTHIFCYCPMCGELMGYFGQFELRKSLRHYCSRTCAGKAANMPLSERPEIKVDERAMLSTILMAIYSVRGHVSSRKEEYFNIRPNPTFGQALWRTTRSICLAEEIRCVGKK